MATHGPQIFVAESILVEFRRDVFHLDYPSKGVFNDLSPMNSPAGAVRFG